MSGVERLKDALLRIREWMLQLPIPTEGVVPQIRNVEAALSAIEVGGGALQPSASVPTEQADGGVVVPRDQLETLRRSLELGNLLPGEGETLINCWIFASEAESKA